MTFKCPALEWIGRLLLIGLPVLIGCDRGESTAITGAAAVSPAAETASSAGASLTLEPASLTLRATSDPKTREQPVKLTLKNTGSTPVKLREIQMTCGCTIVENLQIGEIPPGESVTIQLRARLPEYGARQASITAVTEPRAVPAAAASLTLLGEKKRHESHLSVIPGTIYVSGTAPGSDSSARFLLRATEPDGEPWITELKPSTEEIAVVIERTRVEFARSDDGTVIRIYECEITGQIPANSSQRQHAFLTPCSLEGPFADHLRIPVVLEYLPAVRVIPSLLAFRPQGADPVRRRELILFRTEKGDWIAEPPADLPEWVTVEPQPETEDRRGKRFVVTIDEKSLPDSPEEGPLKAVLPFRCFVDEEQVDAPVELVVEL